MPVCTKCEEGYTTYEEGNRMVRDACYHCNTSGIVDDDTAHHDKVMQVAMSLAHLEEGDYRKACDSDPDGDGYNLHAAENGMTTFDYFQMRCIDRADSIGKRIAAMSIEDQKLLIAWDEMVWDEVPEVVLASNVITMPNLPSISMNDLFGDDNIPF